MGVSAKKKDASINKKDKIAKDANQVFVFFPNKRAVDFTPTRRSSSVS